MHTLIHRTQQTTKELHVISSLRREVDENCALLGYYAASSGDLFPTFRDKLNPIFKGLLNWD